MTAWLLLLLVDTVTVWGGFGALCKFVKRTRVHKWQDGSPLEPAEIVLALRRANVFAPRHYKCLKYWAAGTCLFRHYGHSADFVIAVKQQPFDSHAWLEHRGNTFGIPPQDALDWTILLRA